MKKKIACALIATGVVVIIGVLIKYFTDPEFISLPGDDNWDDWDDDFIDDDIEGEDI